MSRISIFTLILVLLLSSVDMAKMDVKSNSGIIRVPEDYPVIQWAINAAKPGDTILVSEGTYYERIVINKTLNLLGENRDKTIIDARGTGTVVAITADNVNFSGFTIRGGNYGIDIASFGNKIFNNIVKNNVYGIYQTLFAPSNSLIYDNIIENNNFGLCCDGNIIKNNVITLNRGIYSGYGLDCGHSIVYNNSITENYCGISLNRVSDWNNLFVSNTIANNKIGISVGIVSTPNVVYHNNFINNDAQIEGTSSNVIWDNGAEGNYWSDYQGKDFNGDGIGDTLIPHLGVDKYPLVERWSPVRTFNAFTWNGITYKVTIESNNTVASFVFNHSLKFISFNVTGPTGDEGFCNVTIPRKLLDGKPWTILLDNMNVTQNAIIRQDEKNTHIYLNFNFSTHNVKILGTEALDTVPPVANAGPDQIVNEDSLVTFDGSNSSDNVGIVNYTWTFIDKTIQILKGVEPTYVFETPGTYVVTLNVSDAVGNWDTDNVTITVLDVTKPTAIFDVNPQGPVTVGTTLTFDASKSIDNVGIVSYGWDFGDGTTAKGVKVTHKYTKSGTYNVTLTVKDSAGNINTTSLTVKVEESPPSVIYAIFIVCLGALLSLLLYRIVRWKRGLRT